MRRNSKLAVLIVLVTMAILVWVRKDGNIPDVSSATTSVAFEQATPLMGEVLRKRTEFVAWERNPFAWPQREADAGSVSNVTLFAIFCSDEGACAAINGSIVRVGDKITDKTVKRIEQSRVILTDGTRDYVLALTEASNHIERYEPK